MCQFVPSICFLQLQLVRKVFFSIALAVTLLFPSALLADNAKFDSTSGVLSIPVVEVPNPFTGKADCYQADLSSKSSSSGGLTFSLSNAAPTQCGSTGGTVYTKVTPSEVGRILDDLGITYESKTDSAGDPLMIFKLADYNTLMFFYGCSNDNCKSLQLFSGFGMSRSPSLSLINEWNRRYRFSSAYLDSDDDPVLAYDLDIDGGIRAEVIKDFIRRFEVSLETFVEHIGFTRARRENNLSQYDFSKISSYQLNVKNH